MRQPSDKSDKSVSIKTYHVPNRLALKANINHTSHLYNSQYHYEKK